MKVIVIGAVGTTAITIEKLHEHAFEIVGVLGHEPLNKNRVAGLNNLRQICENLSLEYLGFQKINDFENLDKRRIAVGLPTKAYQDFVYEK